MNTAVPIEAAVKDRVNLPRRLDVSRPCHHVVELVGILPSDVFEGVLDKLAREFDVEDECVLHCVTV